MIKSALIRSSYPSPLLLQAKDLHHDHHRRRHNRRATFTCSSSSRSYGSIPKLKPFSLTMLERALKNPSLIERTEKDLLDYCTTLEGEECYNCWMGYFELKDLENEMREEDIERLILLGGDFEHLIERLHRITMRNKDRKSANSLAVPPSVETKPEGLCPVPDGLPKSQEELEVEERDKKSAFSLTVPPSVETKRERQGPIPDGLPKSQEEIEEEERDRMQDTQYTRMLRAMGIFPAWYTPRPDHETD